MFCLNLCEIFTSNWIEEKCFEKLYTSFCKEKGLIKRIYIGSSFCSQYYLKFTGYEKLLTFCKNEKIAVTLVLPLFSEKDITFAHQKTNEILDFSHGIVDEVTVNDVGSLGWIHQRENIHINLGRLFF
ncbi:MAG: hypothetical protein ACI4U3_10525, partial [Traorella sp.]